MNRILRSFGFKQEDPLFLKSRLEDILILLLPFPLFLVLFYEFFLNPAFAQTNRITISFLAKVVFFDSLHTGFTFCLMANSKEGAAWSKEFLDKKKLILFFSAIFGIFFILFYKMANVYMPNELDYSNDVELNPIVALLFISVPKFHVLTQFRGIGFSYDNLFQKKNPMKEITLVHRVEKHLVFLLFILVFFHEGLIQFGIFKRRDPLVFYPYMILFTLGFFYLQRLQFLFRPANRNFKLLYNIRYIIFLFFAFKYAITGFVIQMLHGMEALLFYRKIFSSSTARVSFIYIAGFYCFFLTTIIVIEHKVIDFPSVVITTFAALRWTHTYAHYLMERWLFGFRNDVTRKHILPLLLK